VTCALPEGDTCSPAGSDQRTEKTCAESVILPPCAWEIEWISVQRQGKRVSFDLLA
jgi:hypothetical protein